MTKILSVFIGIFVWLNANSQTIVFYRLDALWVTTDLCNLNKLPCEWDYTTSDIFAGYAYHPDGRLLAVVGEAIDQTFEYFNINIYDFDQSNCTYNLINSIPLSRYSTLYGNGLNIDFKGRIYFALHEFDENSGQYKNTFNRISNPLSDNIETLLTLVPNHRFWEMHQQDGKYFLVDRHQPYIRVYDENFTIEDTIIMQKHITGLTSFSFSCDSVITYASHLDITSEEFANSGPGDTVYISEYNFETNVLTPICKYFLNDDAVTFLTSPLEFLASDPECDLLIDLDRDNSSGVYPYDYLDAELYCTNIKIPISDEDTYIHSSAPIDSIILTLSGIQDYGIEKLVMDPIPSGISFVQLTDSTYLITSSIPSDSIYTLALESIYYSHTGQQHSAGSRNILVQGFNEIKSGVIITSQINLAPSITYNINSTTCIASEVGVFTTTYMNQFGCDSIVINTVELVAADITRIVELTCDSSLVNMDSTTYTNQFGCDSIVILETVIGLLPQLKLDVLSEINGYAISCYGQEDGKILASVQGMDPFLYHWSSGSNDQELENLGAGIYSVTITDINGCKASSEIVLVEPDETSLLLEINSPSCFGDNDGYLKVTPQGGVLPFLFSLNGSDSQTSPDFSGLTSGTYSIRAIDANGCEVTEIFWINVPMAINVDLGNDQSIFLGDTANIIAIVNIPFDSISNITWTGLGGQPCTNCLSQAVAPIVTTTYTITIANEKGCEDRDSLNVFINFKDDLYIPNIFSPNGDGINDELIVSGSPNISQIKTFSIYDRWGNCVFQTGNFLPDNTNFSWDGTLNGRELNPGVFAYHIVALLNDGSLVNLIGDVVLIK